MMLSSVTAMLQLPHLFMHRDLQQNRVSPLLLMSLINIAKTYIIQFWLAFFYDCQIVITTGGFWHN